jgi:DNA polymerase I-like protein with 3'-5' exonuclease and polymerase domains
LFPDIIAATHTNGQDNARAILNREALTFCYVRDPRQATNAVAKLLKGSTPIALDTETAKLPEFTAHTQAGLEPHLSRVRLIQLYGGGDAIYVFDMFALNMRLLKPIWDKPVVAHNAVFDMKHLFLAGANPHQVGCTMLMANALTGKLSSLAGLAREHLGWNVSKSERTSNWNAAELTEEQVVYAALDAVAVFKLYRILKDQLRKKKLALVYSVMRDAQRAVAQMELNGIHFDTQGHKELMESWQLAKSEAAEELIEILGPHISPDSNQQISAWLQPRLDRKTLQAWPKTKTGQLKADATTLARYPELPLVRPLQKYKDASKMLSTFGTGYAEHINPVTGRIHGSFRIGGTATGRFSCSNPNIQSPPRDKPFRALFSAPPNRVIVVADYGQIELRVAALVSEDRNMLDAYEKGQDLHRKTAATIAGVPIEKVTAQQRQAAKAVNFGLLYGQGARGLARYAKATYGVDMSEDDARKAREAFFKAYAGLKNWQERTVKRAESSKQVTTPGGRIRNFTNEAGGYRYTEALNTPIQGGAAEVLMATLARLEKRLEGVDSKLVNVVHDEIILEVAEKDAVRAKNAVEKAMIEGMKAIFPDAHTLNLVEATVGKNWADAK